MVRRTKEEAEQTRLQIIDAARRIFSANGVSGTTLEQIAAAAGVTRGAIYWHFADKIDLFFAMRDQVALPLFDEMDDTALAESTDPLGGVLRFLLARLEGFEQDARLRETFEIISFKCEYVNAFEDAVQQLSKRCRDMAVKLARAYARAQELGQLRAGIDPEVAGLETYAFMTGMIRLWLVDRNSDTLRPRVRGLIHAHVASRRA